MMLTEIRLAMLVLSKVILAPEFLEQELMSVFVQGTIPVILIVIHVTLGVCILTVVQVLQDIVVIHVMVVVNLKNKRENI